MKVYHGSYAEIEEIDLSKCESNRDFGKGFYVTNLQKQAKYWAKRKGKPHGNDGFVTEFTFYENAFTSFHLKTLRFENYTEEWLDFVVMNRNIENINPTHDYDIVEGPVADDDIATKIFVYLEGGISKEDFIEELKFKHEPSHQIAFCTVKSLQMLKLTNSKMELALLNIDGEVLKMLVTDFNLSENEAIDKYFTSNTYKQLIDKSTLLYQKPWEEIYEILKKELQKQ